MSYERKKSNTTQKIFLTEEKKFCSLFAIDIDLLEYRISVQLCIENFPTHVFVLLSPPILKM